MRSQRAAAVSNSFSVSLLPVSCSQGQNLGNNWLTGRPAGALTYKVQNFQSIRSQCSEGKDKLLLFRIILYKTVCTSS